MPTAFEFILYKHGPFAFDLRDELGAMRAYQLLELVPQQIPYGPRWQTTPNAAKLQENYPVTLEKYHAHIDFVATQLGNKRIGELEKLATALYVSREDSTKNDGQLAERIHELKPHVSLEDALAAFQEFQAISTKAETICKVKTKD